MEPECVIGESRDAHPETGSVWVHTRKTHRRFQVTVAPQEMWALFKDSRSERTQSIRLGGRNLAGTLHNVEPQRLHSERLPSVSHARRHRSIPPDRAAGNRLAPSSGARATGMQRYAGGTRFAAGMAAPQAKPPRPALGDGRWLVTAIQRASNSLGMPRLS